MRPSRTAKKVLGGRVASLGPLPDITAYIAVLLLRLAKRRYVLVVVLHALGYLCLGLLG
jgi:branched-subunit amino acid transport protein AzlD